MPNLAAFIETKRISKLEVGIGGGEGEGWHGKEGDPADPD